MKNLRTLSVTKVMAATGFSRARIYRLLKTKKLVAVREGHGTQHILEASLDAYFEAATHEVPRSRDAIRRATDAALGETPGRFS